MALLENTKLALIKKDKLARDGMVPSLYRRYIDDTLARMPNTDAASDFLATLNGLHPSLKFTVELLRILSLLLVFRSLRMGQNLKLVFTESRPTPVYSYIFKAMLTNVTKPVY